MNPTNLDLVYWEENPTRQLWHYVEREPVSVLEFCRATPQKRAHFRVFHPIHQHKLSLPYNLAELVPIEGDTVIPVAKLLDEYLAAAIKKPVAVNFSIERTIWRIDGPMATVTPALPVPVPLKCFSVLNPVQVDHPAGFQYCAKAPSLNQLEES